MAFGKMRNNKRSSSTSYTSTITTIVFIALCVLGVWMLTSNSLMPPQTTTRTTRSATTTTNVFPSSVDSHPIKPIHKKDDSPAFEDNPGNLPEDAIKSDEHYGPENIKVDEKSHDEPENGGGNGKADEDINTKEQSSSVFEKISQVMKGKESAQEKERQNEHETQVSEESSLTQNQQAAVQNNNEITSEQRNSEAKETQQIRSNDNGHVEDSKMEEQNGSEKQFESRESLQKSMNVKKQQQKQGDAQQNEIPGESRKSKAQKNETPEESQTAKGDQESHKKKVSNTSQKAKQGKMKKDGKAATQSNPSTPKKSEKAWSTQADQSENEKERIKDGSGKNGDKWLLCNVTAGEDYIPCLDNEKAISKLRTRKHYEHRERHCPEEGPTCLVPVPQGYKKPIEWPTSRDKIWYHNVPHTLLAEVKGHQNWVKLTGEFLTFPGGGTQFIHGALHYIDFIEQSVPKIAWGKHTRVIMDVGCGVASFGGFLFEREVIAMSFAPKDEHEAQVQFALERGIPAISAVMGTQRLPFPSGVFDLVHCARCRVPWHINGGALLLELNRVMRPGSYFVWSATPVYQKVDDDEEIWREMSSLTTSMCWELVTIKKDPLNFVGAAIYQKPMSNECYDRRKNTSPPMCKSDDDPNAAWYVPLQSCMHRVSVNGGERGSKWPEVWPRRLQTPPYWLNSTQIGIYGKSAPDDFTADHEQWKQEVNNLYLKGMGISWSNVRNVMDMRAVYGGFAAALKDLKVWVFNVVNIDSEDTLPIIYERGLFGIYHDWCESFSTYPRTYDLLHADHLFSRIKKRCNIVALVAEIDRIVRPGGNLIVRDESSIIAEIESLLKSLHWEVQLFSKDQERVLRAQKTFWRPVSYAPSS